MSIFFEPEDVPPSLPRVNYDMPTDDSFDFEYQDADEEADKEYEYEYEDGEEVEDDE